MPTAEPDACYSGTCVTCGHAVYRIGAETVNCPTCGAVEVTDDEARELLDHEVRLSRRQADLQGLEN